VSELAGAETVPEETRYADGGLKARGARLDGALHGDWEFYRQDGSLMRSGSFSRGRQTGIWRTFRRDGTLVKATDFGV